MENLLHEALEHTFTKRLRQAGPKFTVVEEMYGGKRVVFRTDSEMEANRIASEHAARKVVVNS